MEVVFQFILPLIIIVFPLLLQTCCSRIATKKRSFPLLIAAGLLSLCIGLITPILATYVSISKLDWYNREPGCVTGAASFIFFGYILSFLIIPVTIIRGFQISKRNKIPEYKIL